MRSDIARGVAVGVIEPLEEIHVDHGHGQRLVVAACPAQLDDDPLVEIATVGKAGETVAPGEAAQALGAQHDCSGENRRYAQQDEPGNLGRPVEEPVGEWRVPGIVEIPQRSRDQDQRGVFDDSQETSRERNSRIVAETRGSDGEEIHLEGRPAVDRRGMRLAQHEEDSQTVLTKVTSIRPLAKPRQGR